MTRKQLRQAYNRAYAMYQRTHSRAWERALRRLNLELMVRSANASPNKNT
mgnify:CR=1 FL=1